MTPDFSASQRWYDKHQTVSKSVKLLETFPEEIQEIIADGIMRLAIRECRANELMDDLKSLGPEKVLAIFKSKNRRRSYDANNIVHKAMNYLYILSEENRLFIANQVIEIVNDIYNYLKICKQYEVGPDVDEVSEITRVYIEVGADEAKALIERIQEKFTTNISKVSIRNEELTEDREGLRLREDS